MKSIFSTVLRSSVLISRPTVRHDGVTVKRLNCVETLRKIVDSNLSIARFGDGELRMAFSNKSLEFQVCDPSLSRRLQHLLVEPRDGVLCTFNNYYADNTVIQWIAEYERYTKKYSGHQTCKTDNDICLLFRPRDFLMYNLYWRKIMKNTNINEFGDTSVFYIGCYTSEYYQNQIELVKEYMRRLFSDRRILFVGPEQPLGGPSFKDQYNLLKRIGMRSAEFMPVPARNAYAFIDAIATEIRRQKNFDDIFIQAGPTATILSGELAGTIDARLVDAGSLNTQLRYLEI